MELKSVFAGFCLALATCAPSSAQKLEFVAGVFTYSKFYGVDYDPPIRVSNGVIVAQKLKYPFVSAAPGEGELLLLLAIHDDQYRLHAWRLEDLMEGNLGVLPARSHPASWPTPDPFSSPPRIVAFFRGGTFLETNNGEAILRRVSDAKEIWKGDSLRDYGHWRKHRAYAGSTGLVLDDDRSPFFDCLEVFSVDYNNDGVFAIGYQDESREPRICLRSRPAAKSCECEPSSRVPGFDPRFSRDGRLFATVAKQDDLWNLHVYSLAAGNGESREPVKTVPDVAYYDITTESFVYLGSYGWAENQLFFKKRLRTRGEVSEQDQARQARSVYRIVCTEGAASCGEPELLQPPECVRLVPPESTAGTELVWLKADADECQGKLAHPEKKELALDLDIKEIVWAQPFRHQGETFLAVEAITRPRYTLQLKQTKWLSRILIFRVR